MACLLLAGCVTQREWIPPDAEAGRQIARWIATPNDEDPKAGFQCWMYLPTHYASRNENEMWPLLLFLHGSGECGDDLNKVRAFGGPPKLLAQPGAKRDWPFITVSPQSARGFYKPPQLSALLDALEREYRVDPKRIYVTGLSMGGIGTWALALYEPERFAAIAPISGGGDVKQAAKLVDLPVWAFHGDADKNVNVRANINMIKAIQTAGGKKAKLTIYPGVNHDAWTRTYNDPALYTWLLSNRRK